MQVTEDRINAMLAKTAKSELGGSAQWSPHVWKPKMVFNTNGPLVCEQDLTLIDGWGGESRNVHPNSTRENVKTDHENGTINKDQTPSKYLLRSQFASDLHQDS